MRGILSAALGALLFALPLTAGAEQAAGPGRTVVVELFTSQGCSSCPPADELLGRLADHDGVIALGFHVDYWDYIGWKDEFGSPAFTARQKAYAVAAGKRTVYTPQMIVEGEARVVGFKPMEVSSEITRYRSQAGPAGVTLTRNGDKLKIRAEARAPLASPANIELVRYIPERRVAIRRGENAGRTMDYHNIVTSLTTLATWDGKTPYEADVKIDGDEPAVVLIQEPGPGAILAAAQVD